MKTAALRKAALPLPLVAMLALPACGGGGGQPCPHVSDGAEDQ